MIPKINHRGHSFKGVMAYLMHDKNAASDERVVWSETGNMHTNDLEKAAKVMAWTDQNADVLKRDFGGSGVGRKSEAGAVYHYSLSWAQSEQPDQQHQRFQALETLERLGLNKHQFVMVAHNDTDHAHIHVVANLTDPETGKRHVPSFDKRELQSYALEYERQHGLHCHVREENAAKREQGGATKYREQKQDYSQKITRAYYAADSGKAFIHALHDEGLQLAAARRGSGFVIVDDKGDIQKLARQLDIEEKGKAKTAAINSKLADIERENLADADQLSQKIKLENTREPESYDRDAEEIRQQKSLADAAHREGKEKARLQAEKEAKAAAEERTKALLEKQKLQKAEAKARAERNAQIQRRIDEKTAASRKKWQIDELAKARVQAKVDYQKSNTFFNRLFRRGKIEAARDHWHDMHKRLEERRTRWLADIDAFNKKRPEWVQDKECEKLGFGKAKDLQREAGPSRLQEAAKNLKVKKENATSRGAEVRPKQVMKQAQRVTAEASIPKERVSQKKEQQEKLGEQVKQHNQERVVNKKVQFKKIRRKHAEPHQSKSISQEKLRGRYNSTTTRSHDRATNGSKLARGADVGQRRQTETVKDHQVSCEQAEDKQATLAKNRLRASQQKQKDRERGFDWE
jgi:MobA/VirD2-like, nuclease domain